METPAKYLSADERRAVTVEAVVALAASGNPGDITTTAIARHMGVTQGALFKHFPNKEAILEAVMQWVANKLLARIDRAIAVAPTPWAALEAVFMAHVQFAVQHPGVPRMLFGELQRADNSAPKRLAQTLMRQYAQRLHALVAQAQAQGSVAADVDVQATALLFIGSVQGLVMQALLAGDVRQMKQQAPAVYALFARALAAGTAPPQKAAAV
ncbi:Nucleoid occlusion factor SlmA [uncultured Comamonas sp.]|nr:Nucleoid occlusion factor SlmA [uncultured Comamonas sp.]